MSLTVALGAVGGVQAVPLATSSEEGALRVGARAVFARGRQELVHICTKQQTIGTSPFIA